MSPIEILKVLKINLRNGFMPSKSSITLLPSMYDSNAKNMQKMIKNNKKVETSNTQAVNFSTKSPNFSWSLEKYMYLTKAKKKNSEAKNLRIIIPFYFSSSYFPKSLSLP